VQVRQARRTRECGKRTAMANAEKETRCKQEHGTAVICTRVRAVMSRRQAEAECSSDARQPADVRETGAAAVRAVQEAVIKRREWREAHSKRRGVVRANANDVPLCSNPRHMFFIFRKKRQQSATQIWRVS